MDILLALKSADEPATQPTRFGSRRYRLQSVDTRKLSCAATSLTDRNRAADRKTYS
ncbi:hypothetical protein ACFSBW_09675 [Halohasta litorea]|uniref:Uncharacterized protein n=1 Tax=Halohasta litorea TaxID=869891 RepID=A0ABD6D946_9EURY